MEEYTIEYSTANKSETISFVLGLALNKAKLKRKNITAPSVKRMMLRNIVFGIIFFILSPLVRMIPTLGYSLSYLFVLAGILYVFYGLMFLYQWKKTQQGLADSGRITINSKGIRDEDSEGREQMIPWGDVDVVFVSDEVIVICQKQLPVIVFCGGNYGSKNTVAAAFEFYGKSDLIRYRTVK